MRHFRHRDGWVEYFLVPQRRPGKNGGNNRPAQTDIGTGEFGIDTGQHAGRICGVVGITSLHVLRFPDAFRLQEGAGAFFPLSQHAERVSGVQAGVDPGPGIARTFCQGLENIEGGLIVV